MSRGSKTNREIRESDSFKNSRRNIDYPTIGLWISLVISALVWIIPFAFMLLTSLKTNNDIAMSSPWALPKTWAWNNYPDSWRTGALATTGWNSLVIAFVKVPLGLLFSATAAFALSRIENKFNRALLGIFAMGAMIPIQIALGPIFAIVNHFNLLNTKIGLILPYLAFGIPYQVFLFYGFFKAIPKELDEAARIDGAGNWRLFFKVILPLAKPAFAALYILDFVATWNEFSIALTLLPDQKAYTIPLALQNFNSQYQNLWGQLNAFVVSSMLPVLIVYLLFQRHFTSGALSGAIKG